MTALAGAFAWPSPGSGALCRRLLAAQSAFGPREPALWEGDGVALGRRLFHASPGDRAEPARFGEIVLAADVRLDDRRSLEAQLGDGAAGASGQGLLARGWMAWGEGLFDRIVGPFALVIWDGRDRRLRLVRDGFGLRPLYLMRQDGGVAFASTVMGLLAVREAPPAMDEIKLAELLALEPERGPRTCFEGIERVEPGGVVTIDGSGVASRRWFALRPADLQACDGEAARSVIRDRLGVAVDACLEGAGPVVAAHLSSGWDSVAVATLAARRLQGGRLLALTAAPHEDFAAEAPEGHHFDESAMAAAVAAREPSVEHLIVRSHPRPPLEALDRMSRLLGRPVPNPCNQAWIGDLCEAAVRSGARVLLTGHFGNETISWSGTGWLAELAAQRRWAPWSMRALQAMAFGGMRPGGVLASSLEAPEDNGLWRLGRRLAGGWVPRPGRVSSLRPELWRRVHRPPVRRTRLDRTMHAATAVDLGPIDKAHLAAFGVDTRHPLMDRRLVEACLGAPPELVFARGRSRRFARALLEGLAPAFVLDQKTRGLQAADWFERLEAGADEIRAEIERLAAVPPAARLIDLGRLTRLAAAPPAEGWLTPSAAIDYRFALWRGAAAGRFMRQSLGLNV